MFKVYKVKDDNKTIRKKLAQFSDELEAIDYLYEHEDDLRAGWHMEIIDEEGVEH